MKFFDLFGKDNASAPSEDQDMPASPFVQEIVHVFKELHMASLVGGYCHRMSIFLDGTINDLLHGPVVSEMDHLRPAGLQDTAHDINGCIVAVK